MTFKVDVLGPSFKLYDPIMDPLRSSPIEDTTPYMLICSCPKGHWVRSEFIQTVFDKIKAIGSQKPDWLHEDGSLKKHEFLSSLPRTQRNKFERIWSAAVLENGYLNMDNLHICAKESLHDKTITNQEAYNLAKRKIKEAKLCIQFALKEIQEHDQEIAKADHTPPEATRLFEQAELATRDAKTLLTLIDHQISHHTLDEVQALEDRSNELKATAASLIPKMTSQKKAELQKQKEELNRLIEQSKKIIEDNEQALKQSLGEDTGLFAKEDVHMQTAEVCISQRNYTVYCTPCEQNMQSLGYAISHPAITKKVSLYNEESESYGELTLEMIQSLEKPKALVNRVSSTLGKSEVVEIDDPRFGEEPSIFTRVYRFFFS